MKFSDVNETVTAKESVNLRDIPSQGNDSTIKATLNNGDTAQEQELVIVDGHVSNIMDRHTMPFQATSQQI